MSEHYSVERMHDAVDGLLSAAEMQRLDAHGAECEACRRDYARISETVEAIRSLPKAASTPERVWDGIAARIDGVEAGAEPAESDVLRFPTPVEARRTFSFTAPQLAAAALIVSLVSTTVVWTAMGGGSDATPRAAVGSEPGPSARVVAAASTRYDAVVSDLELILEQGRSVLSAETLLTIEASLTTVNSAIEEIEVALQEDPNSDMLHRMLSANQRTKLGVLQRAADAVRAQT